jgi:hypothetical protein
MAYYDRFHATEDNDHDVISIKPNDLQMVTGFHNVKRTYTDSDGAKQKFMLEYYVSGDIGSLIRNAVTGIKYKDMLIGSRNEDYFFTITMATGIRDKPAVKLFYDSPQQYEYHQHVELSKYTVKKWIDKHETFNKF